MKAQFTEPNTGRRFIGEAERAAAPFAWRVVVGNMPFLLSEAEAAIFNLIVVHGGEKTNTDRDQ